MAKRYHQSVKDRMKESRGMEREMLGHAESGKKYGGVRRESLYGSGYEEHEDMRRSMERDGSSMIYEDHNAVANLPQHVIQREWPKGGYAQPMGPNDDIEGVNHQMSADSDKALSQLKPRKA